MTETSRQTARQGTQDERRCGAGKMESQRERFSVAGAAGTISHWEQQEGRKCFVRRQLPLTPTVQHFGPLGQAREEGKA